MLLCILGQFYQLWVRFLCIITVGAIHQCGAHSKENCLIIRLQKHKEERKLQVELYFKYI